MALDPYGNEVVDPFDQAIADGVMRSTWSSAILGLIIAFTSGCCIPLGSLGVSQVIVLGLVGLWCLLALAAAGNAVLRVVTMQPEHRRLVPGWQPWAALGVALLAAGLAVLPMIGVALQLVAMFVLG